MRRRYVIRVDRNQSVFVLVNLECMPGVDRELRELWRQALIDTPREFSYDLFLSQHSADFLHNLSSKSELPTCGSLVIDRQDARARKALRLLGNHFAVFPYVQRRAVHSSCLPRILRRTTQSTSYSCGKAYRLTGLRSHFRLHRPFSNNRGGPPELSYTAQLSANGR